MYHDNFDNLFEKFLDPKVKNTVSRHSGLRKKQKMFFTLFLHIDQKGKCIYCKQNTFLCIVDVDGNREDSATLDHKIPKSKNGGNDLDNFVVSCQRCNRIKSNDISYEQMMFLFTMFDTDEAFAILTKLRKKLDKAGKEKKSKIFNGVLNEVWISKNQSH